MSRIPLETPATMKALTQLLTRVYTKLFMEATCQRLAEGGATRGIKRANADKPPQTKAKSEVKTRANTETNATNAYTPPSPEEMKGRFRKSAVS